ncbi:uncharacterized protein SAPINGB_P000001 [Magnusiomyces paraingens]|uniref:A to I editase domain-containing protein n=1 Tax=Magnusiomyces paraingens TaxID=2606893 RepID=A0A5E8AWD1_9ASCO|nr:uncharacterized protein SAPINGB_P000001 [Saprochaete ingens]VVT43473.1 unnamed protein product [Saprochaete ingens]
MVLADRVAQCVIETFLKLPPKGKPVKSSNRPSEWTILAGIVLESAQGMECVALATGLKASPDAIVKISNGNILHDSHAEILAIRTFNHFLLNEISQLPTHHSKYIQAIENPASSYLFEGFSNVKIHMYISAAPCGDASLSLLSDLNQDERWTDPIEPVVPGGPLRGREHFFHTGYVRTKPGRRDSPITLSKSCSDKLAMKIATSLLLGPTSTIISPKNFYLSSLTIPESEYRTSDINRAFGPQGRLKGLQTQAPIHGTYSPHFFTVFPTKITFPFQKSKESKPCSQSLIYFLNAQEDKSGTFKKSSEVLFSGVKIGNKILSGNGTSRISRRGIFSDVVKYIPQHQNTSYLDFKNLNDDRRKMKQEVYKILNNWTPTSDDDFKL